MYCVRKSVDVDFSHHVRGHAGACINLHGHTWKLEVEVGAECLDDQGFVVDFGVLKREVLKPCHTLLDHALAVGEATYAEIEAPLEQTGRRLLASRAQPQAPAQGVHLAGARNMFPGGMKVALFPFDPTSERLAEWLFRLAAETLNDARVQVRVGRVYETLHPVQSVAEFTR